MARKGGRGPRTQLVLTGAMAATLSSLGGCSSGPDWDDNVVAASDTEICIDEDGYRVEEWQCDDDGYRGLGGGGWFYVSRGSVLPYYGDRVVGGDLDIKGSKKKKAGAYYSRAPSSANMTRSAAVARGGFGSSGRGFGGGRS